MEEEIMNEMSIDKVVENATDLTETVCKSSGGFSVGRTLAGAGIIGVLGYAGYRLWKWAKTKKHSKSATGSATPIEAVFTESHDGDDSDEEETEDED